MKHMYLGAVIAVWLTAILPAKAFDSKDYKAYAEEMRRTVWAQEGLPEFSNYKCPEKYRHESAVILAAYDEILLDQKSKLKTFALNFYTIKQLNYNRLRRQLIYINDQQSLKKFSEFDYTTYKKEHNIGIGDDITRNVLGVRIIKPDGTVREVESDDYVTANEGKKDKDKREKLAVPGLQVGDVLDVFTSEMRQVREENIAPMLITYVNSYPTLSYRVHCSIDPKLTIQYRTLNGAPDFTQSRDEDKNIILDAMVNNIDLTEPELWYNPMVQTPLTLLFIQSKKIKNVYIPESVKDKGLQANPSAETIQHDDWAFWDNVYQVPLSSNGKKVVKDADSKFKSDEEKADYIYNFLTMEELFDGTDDHRSPSRFIQVFGEMLNKAKVDYSRGMTTTDSNEPIDQLISYRNTTWLIRLPNGKIYTPPVGPFTPGYIPSSLQGRKAVFSKALANKTRKGPFEPVTLPQSKMQENGEHAQVNVKIDGLQLHIDRTISLTGTSKERASLWYASSKQICDAYAKDYGGVKTYEGLASKKAKAQMPELIQKADERVKSNFLKEIEEYHGSAPQQFAGGKMVALGRDKLSDPFVFETHYTMDGLVKRAGGNIVVSVGKLIGDQLKIEGKDRRRVVDVYRTAPVLLQRVIDIALPAGYEVSRESLNQLNSQLENDCALFKATAETTPGHLVVRVTKGYKHRTEPVSNWAKMLQFVDAAHDYLSKQVVLRKQ